jgi:hypothetical protein
MSRKGVGTQTEEKPQLAEEVLENSKEMKVAVSM